MLALTFHATKSRASGWHNSEAMTAGNTNQADMTIFPRVEEDPLPQERTNVKDSEIANNHHIYEYISLYSWYDCTNDVWMWCPLREPDCVQLDKHRGCVLLRRTFTKLNVTKLEFIMLYSYSQDGQYEILLHRKCKAAVFTTPAMVRY